MRVLFILENYYPAIGGVETLFKSLIDKLEEHNIESIIMTTRHHDLPKIEKLGNTTVIRYKFYSRYIFTFLAFFPALIHGRKVDLIHTTSYNAGLPASLAGFFLNKKVIITFHEVWGKLWFKLPFFGKISKFLHYSFEQLLLKMPFHKFIAVSEFTASRLVKYGIAPEKIRTIYNGIDPTNWTHARSKKNESNFQFVYFGRLGISKGLDLLLPAFLKTQQKHPECRLTLILPFEPANQLKFVKDSIAAVPKHLRPLILHELPHEELVHTIGQSDCVVIPSYSEGFGFTAVESMAMEMPIISSGQGSLKEVIGGNLIEMKNQDVPSLMDAIEKALNGDWEYREPKKFVLTDTVDQYIKLYDQILNGSDTHNQIMDHG